MALKQPESMDECVYFTRRAVDSGKVMCWVFRETCPKCKKGLMTKPYDEKAGKFKVRAKEYLCGECGHSVPKQEYEDTLTANIQYTCPHCGKQGETQVPYKRKTYQGVKAIVFECNDCGKKIPITKKMKAAKKKGKKSPVDED